MPAITDVNAYLAQFDDIPGTRFTASRARRAIISTSSR